MMRPFSLTFLCLMEKFQTPKTHPDMRNPVNTLGPAKQPRKSFFVAGGKQQVANHTSVPNAATQRLATLGSSTNSNIFN